MGLRAICSVKSHRLAKINSANKIELVDFVKLIGTTFIFALKFNESEPGLVPVRLLLELV